MLSGNKRYLSIMMNVRDVYQNFCWMLRVMITCYISIIININILNQASCRPGKLRAWNENSRSHYSSRAPNSRSPSVTDPERDPADPGSQVPGEKPFIYEQKS